MSKLDEVEDLSNIILTKLSEICDKFVNKHKLEPYILTALQTASVNFLGSVIMANSKMLNDKSKQLDYAEIVKSDVDYMFEQIKIQIKSIDLH